MSAVAKAVDRHQLSATTLGALAEYITSGSRDWSKYYANSGAMFIRTQDINQNRLSLEAVAYVQLPAKIEGKRSLVRKGDLLITITGANVGKVAVVEQELPEAYVSQSVCLVRLNDPSLAMFLQLQLISRRGEKSALEAMAYGLGRPVLNLENVRAAPVKVGPPEIRADIVAELEKQLSRLDEAVAILKRVKANLKRYKAAVLKAAIEGRLVPSESELARREGRTYETGAQLLQRVLECHRQGNPNWRKFVAPDVSDLPSLPEGWAWSNFASVAERVTVGHVGPMKDEYVEHGVPFLRSQNVRANRFDPGGLKFISEAFHRRLGKSALRPGDIVVVRSGSVGVSCVIPADLADANCSDLVIVKAPRGVLPAFGAYYMNAVVDTRVAAGRVGVALTHFNTQSVAELPLPVPPMAEQHRIITEVDHRLSLVQGVEVEVDVNLSRSESLKLATLARSFGA